MDRIIAVGIGSFFGGILRYLFSGWAAALLGEFFPFGTLIVNILGSFFMGLVMASSIEAGILDFKWRLFLTTGIMGAFTTFSTFSYETLQFIFEGEFLLAALNIFLNLLLGLFGVWLGITLARLLIL
ncbi:fluoride efflux transporter CrcB [Thermovenabulum sp.]|uniref:fluoride efflux transporter CrcB n=1 Tax=Thermovenabulum sp. TaxID=3100335 RepID=UPI003C7A4C4B